jgi:hypothetical protein
MDHPERSKDWRRAAELLNPRGTARDPQPAAVRLRQGTVTAASAANVIAGVCSITLGGDTETTIAGVACLSSYTPLVGDTVWVAVNGTDLMVIGRVGSSDQVAYAEASGSQTVTVTAANNGSATVTFADATRFTVTPRIIVSCSGTTFWVPFSSGASTTGFTASVRHIDGTVTTASPVVEWHAIQMTASSASG